MLKPRLLWQALALVSALPVWSQSFTAGLRGTVTDTSASAVVGAKVVATETDRNIPHNTTTDGAGRYTVTGLPPGNYTLTVEASGFKKFVQQNFALAVQQQATLDVQLQIGEISSTVSVTEAPPLLNTTIANLGQVIDNKVILSLPNLARNSMSLAYLTPGVVGSGGRRGDSNTNFVANGSRNSTSDVLVDGVTVTTVEQNSGITDLKFSPSVDVVQEFKMQTNFFSAEYGQTGGAVVNMVTRSGTNNFHGTGYYFLRDDALNANDFFSNRAGRALPAFHRDQYGGVIGGPVIKNKTFFFGGYEYTKQESPTSATISVPTALQRAGNFTATRNGAGQTMTIYNPFDTFTNAAGGIERRPFPGNMVPQSSFDPIALKALSFLPQGNLPGNSVTGLLNWFGQGINTSTSHQINAKADHNFTQNTRVSGRYSNAISQGRNPNLFGDNNPAYWTGGTNQTNTKAMVVDLNHVRSATTMFNFRYGLTYSDFGRDPFTSFDLTTLGLPANMKASATNLVFPRWAPEGFQEFGTEPYWIMDRQEGVHHWSGFMSKIAGGHNMKMGGERRFNQLDYLQPGNPSGRFNYGRGVTCRDRFTCPGNEGNGLAAMLIGWTTGSEYQIEPKAFSRSAYWGFYFQDDWKVARNLTINLGLRYDFDVPRWEVLDRYSYWDFNTQSKLRATGYDTRGVMKFVDKDRRSPFDADSNNWQPRVGFAWSPTSKISVRSGYGLFYTLSRATVFGRPGTGFTINSPSIWTLDSNATLNSRLNNPFPNGILQPPGREQGADTLLGFGMSTIAPANNRNPEYHSWNLSIQREMGLQSVLELNYTGSRGTHLFMPITTLSAMPREQWAQGRTVLAQQVPNPFFGQVTDSRSSMSLPTVQRSLLLRPFPQFAGGAGVGTAEPARGDSNYHALQVKWEKRYSKGLTMLTHYTWSKMIDNVSHSSGNVSWLGGSTALQDIWNLRGERSLSSHDISHRVVMTGAYELPFGRGRKWGANMNRVANWVAGGWNLSGMLLMQAGMPIQVTQSGGAIWDGTQRPNLIGDPSTTGRLQDRLDINASTGNAYFNRAAFSQPLGDVPGTAPRNLNYRGPGIKTLDAALLKDIVTREGQRFEFRLEATNFTNTPMFGDPAASFGAVNFGQITGLRNGVGPRNMQIGLKYYF